ncbi:hypothetical protein L3Y34_016141 [Caenorhabditis briggsae]|uniref:RING-type E3 ubiquitin transferase n=1 Tax=Caenorhabditis briggsae TaxID=6238 RepID=A0AAE9J0A5_CAEBR|nr:hypothetical protein L3Y34_016141 [Caenorhabditis briggsae]
MSTASVIEQCDPQQSSSTSSSEETPECIREIIRRQVPSGSYCLSPQPQDHPYDRPPPREHPTMRLQMVPRRPATENPVIASLINTVAQARDRKRQREETMYPRRNIGQQTDSDEPITVEQQGPNFYDSGISATKRVRREPSDDEPRPVIIKESIGINTTETMAPARPQHLPSTSTDQQQPSSSSSEFPNNPHIRQFRSAGHRRRERDSPAYRQARRERRERIHHAETIRLQLENHIQTVDGMVPGGHVCNYRCPHYQQIINNAMNHFDPSSCPPPTGPNAVSPTVAPGAFLRTSYNTAVLFPIPTYPAVQVPVMGYAAYTPVTPTPPAQAPPPPPTIHAPVAVRPSQPTPPGFPPSLYSLTRASFAPTGMPDYMDYFRHPSYHYLFPSMDRLGLDRHHMFAGLEIDVPIGASQTDIDKYTNETKYAKKEGEEEDDTCTVCLNNFEAGESIRKLPCNHLFHPECIYKWLDINKKCPMCREEIDRKPVPATTQQPVQAVPASAQ